MCRRWTATRGIVPSLEHDGWELLSAEDLHDAHPGTFLIPDRATRESIRPGAACKLLFDIETRESGIVVDRGVDRMWVIVKIADDGRFVGVLDSEPGRAENLRLRSGDLIEFGPEHIAEIARPPTDYILAKFGPGFLSGDAD